MAQALHQEWLKFLAGYSLEEYSLTDPRLRELHLSDALRWSSRLYKAGFVVPLFVVIDIGTLLYKPDRWYRPMQRSEIDPTYYAEWEQFRHRYWTGIKLIKNILQRNESVGFSSSGATRVPDDSIAFMLISFLYLLGWYAPAAEEEQEIDLIELRRYYHRDLQQFSKAKGNAALLAADLAVFTRIADKQNHQQLELLARDKSRLQDFITSVNMQAARWYRYIETEWKPESLLPGQDCWQFLDGQFVRKYLQHFPFAYARNIMQQLNVVSNKSSVLPTRSKRYTSFEEVTPFGYSINPTELIYMSDQATEDYFWSRWAEESLLKLDSNTPEEDPAEFYVNYHIPDLPELSLYALAEDDQPFISYAKYLSLLLWHDFIYLYVSSGCSQDNSLYFTLYLPTSKGGEQPLSLQVEEELIDHFYPYMLRMAWSQGASSRFHPAHALDAANDLFYRVPLEQTLNRPAEPERESDDWDNPGKMMPNQYWTLFIPDSFLAEARKKQRPNEPALEIGEEDRLFDLLKQDKRQYQHLLVIGFAHTELYRVQYGYRINLHRISEPGTNRTESEFAIREILINHYVNKVLVPALG